MAIRSGKANYVVTNIFFAVINTFSTTGRGEGGVVS